MLFGKLRKPLQFITFRRSLRTHGIQHILSSGKYLQVVAGE
jgi:hypothetical protein